MTAQHALPDHPVGSPRKGRRRLTSVAPSGAGGHRTFADDVEIRSAGPVWHRRERLMPAGFVHAAQVQDEWSLCGILLDSLHEFDRGRHPFERVAQSRRCPVCHAASDQSGSSTGA
jgi:hypothetical protein